MSRRSFIQWLLGSVLFLFSGIFAFFPKDDPLSSTSATLDPSTQPTPSTEPSPTTEPTAKPARGTGALLLSFFLFSDMHISNGDSVTAHKLKLALDDLSSFDTKVEALLFGGDLTDLGRESDYDLLKSILGKYKLPPLYGNMGNHDYYDIWIDKAGAFVHETMPNGKTDAQSRERFQMFLGYKNKPYQEVLLNGVRLLMVSQEAYVQEKSDVGEGAWYSDEQLAWLKERLALNPVGKPVLIMIHQPLPAIGSNGRTHQMIRANEFREILKPYLNVFVFSGHTHRNFNSDTHYTKESFHWFVNSSVGRVRATAGKTGQNGSLSQGMFVQVYENEVLVRGREFSDRTWIDAAKWSISLT